MLGAIAGDIIGSVYERRSNNIKTKDFPLFSPKSRFTDDTVLSVAVTDVILNGGEYADKIKQYYRRYPYAGYGGNFKFWAKYNSNEPYNSWGNGSAMRVSPVGFAFKNLEEVLNEAKRSAEVTHNHPEGIKGAQATATSIFLSRTGKSKSEIKSYIETTFDYNLSQTLAEIRPNYGFDVSCQGSVPQAIISFLESTDFEDAIRNAISLGGDSDTIACITGGIAQAFYGGVPETIAQQALSRLDLPLGIATKTFMLKYNLF
ncbi:MAG: ADP-ribosylglycohydrolase family protein [Moorea sp. SIO2B7]|nr:ADP-ribosylglycohydrolase family protein [Moorena sp. SIO2B7]